MPDNADKATTIVREELANAKHRVEATAVARLANGDHALHASLELALRSCGYNYWIQADVWVKPANPQALAEALHPVSEELGRKMFAALRIPKATWDA